MTYKIRTSIDKISFARTIAYTLVQSKVAVSVHLREISSIYEWEGKICNNNEWEVEALTTQPQKAAQLILEAHTYDSPEIIVEKVTANKAIVDWISNWCGEPEK